MVWKPGKSGYAYIIFLTYSHPCKLALRSLKTETADFLKVSVAPLPIRVPSTE